MRQGLLFSIIVSIVFCEPVLAYDWSTNPGLTNDIVFDPNNNPKHIFDRALIAFDLSDSDNFQGVPFTGSFEGNHFTIQNLYINSNND
ncbi:MAG: hypothetical protein ACYSOK_07210, partial [Planctomycetota bacterium]